MKKIPTLNECLEICEKNTSFKFKKEKINGFNTYQFTYFLASYKDFAEPFVGCTANARELRGLTFVIDNNGIEYVFPFIHKFFNINENESTQLEVVDKIGVKEILNKYDGSAITFIVFPDGSIRAKTKFSFVSEQAKMAQKMLDNNIFLKDYIKYCYLHRNQVCLYELISPFNKIVVNYDRTELVHLYRRGIDDGEYISRTSSVGIVSFNQLCRLQKQAKGIEGWVVITNDGDFVKVKTEEYFNLHKLLTEDLNSESNIIKMILDETIDDAISNIALGSEKRIFIENIQNKIVKYVNNLLDYIPSRYNEIILEVSKETYADIDSREFQSLYAKLAKQSNNMDLLMLFYKNQDIDCLEKSISELILKRTSKLNKAREFLASL